MPKRPGPSVADVPRSRTSPRPSSRPTREVLRDPGARVPAPDPTATGAFARWRAAASRFADGPAHSQRRAALEDLLAAVDVAALGAAARDLAAGRDLARNARTVPVRALGAALGFARPDALAARVALLAAAYPTGAVGEGEAERTDAATRELLALAPEGSAELRVQLLVQAFAATAALAEGRHPPVPSTRRVLPSGAVVDLPLDEVPFGAGAHACPAREHALALAAAVREASA